jgi:septin family protein
VRGQDRYWSREERENVVTKNKTVFVDFLSFLVGASGTGRTTFVNTLCESDVLQHKAHDDPARAHIEEGVRIKLHTVGAWTRRARVSLANPFVFL